MNRTKRSKKTDPQRRTLAVACILCAVVLVGLLATAGVLTWEFSNRVYPLKVIPHTPLTELFMTSIRKTPRKPSVIGGHS